MELNLFGYELEIQPAFFIFYVVIMALVWFNPLLKGYDTFQRIVFSIIMIPILIVILNYQANK